jgi:hypothetical protein
MACGAYVANQGLLATAFLHEGDFANWNQAILRASQGATIVDNFA